MALKQNDPVPAQVWTALTFLLCLVVEAWFDEKRSGHLRQIRGEVIEARRVVDAVLSWVLLILSDWNQLSTCRSSSFYPEKFQRRPPTVHFYTTLSTNLLSVNSLFALQCFPAAGCTKYRPVQLHKFRWTRFCSCSLEFTSEISPWQIPKQELVEVSACYFGVWDGADKAATCTDCTHPSP